MDEELKQAVEQGLAKIKAELTESVKAFDAQVKLAGSASTESKNAIEKLSASFELVQTRLREIEQKQSSFPQAPSSPLSIGETFVKSEAFKQLAQNPRNRHAGMISLEVETKSTVTAVSGTNVFPQQNPGIIRGDFLPLTIRQALVEVPTSTNMVNSLREASWTNSAAEVSQGAAKPESDITFEPYNVPITTIAHWIKVSNQLVADAPTIAAYIDTRLRDGLAQRVDRQLILGNGTSPNLSGLTDSGNYTAYTPESDDNLVEAINRAKWAMWATGNVPDTVIVNPADWGAMERTREGVGTGMYLYGMPGAFAGLNPFGVRIVVSNHVAAGKFIIGSLRSSAVLYTRQAVAVEMGYVNDDFTKNLITIRAEERMGLGVERPAGIYYGDFTTT